MIVLWGESKECNGSAFELRGENGVAEKVLEREGFSFYPDFCRGVDGFEYAEAAICTRYNDVLILFMMKQKGK